MKTMKRREGMERRIPKKNRRRKLLLRVITAIFYLLGLCALQIFQRLRNVRAKTILFSYPLCGHIH